MSISNKPIVLLLICIVTLYSCREKSGELETKYIETHDVEDIVGIDDTLVPPIDYLNLISLKELPVEDRKERFIQQILPSILICKHNLEQQKAQVEDILSLNQSRISHKQKRVLDSLFSKYRTDNVEELLIRLNTHPVSVVIAQAALESAWGTSRFYSEGNNVFGIWSFSESDERIASLGLRNGKPVYLKKYRSLSESVLDYFLVLGRGPFKEFREKRMESNDPILLVDFLTNYSEKRNEYSNILQVIIRKNDLTRYDHYHLDPEFIR